METLTTQSGLHETLFPNEEGMVGKEEERKEPKETEFSVSLCQLGGSGLAPGPLLVWNHECWFLVPHIPHVLKNPSVMVNRRGIMRDSTSQCKWEAFWTFFIAVEMLIAKAGTLKLG